MMITAKELDELLCEEYEQKNNMKKFGGYEFYLLHEIKFHLMAISRLEIILKEYLKKIQAERK